MKSQLKILLLTSAFFMMAGGLFGPLYAVFVEEIGGDLLTAGGAYAVYAIATGILIFFVSKWEDRVKHKERLIVGGYFLNCCGYLGYLLIREPWHLFVVQIIFGIGTAITNPAYDGLYSKYLDKKKFISEWGVWESLAFCTTGVAAGIGGFVAEMYGFRVLFAIMLSFSVIGLIVVTRLLYVKNYRSRRRKSPKSKRFKRR